MRARDGFSPKMARHRNRPPTVRPVALRITLAVVAVLAVGAGIFAGVTYWQHVRHDDACSTYANALIASVAEPGVKPDRSILNLLSAQDRKAVTTSDGAYNTQLNDLPPPPYRNDPQVQAKIDSYDQAWAKWATSFKAQALAARGC